MDTLNILASIITIIASAVSIWSAVLANKYKNEAKNHVEFNKTKQGIQGNNNVQAGRDYNG
jgi:hypothetical protein